MKFQEHRIEIVGGIILLLISILLPLLGISKDVAWFVGITSILLAITIAILKEHLAAVIHKIIEGEHTNTFASQITAIMSELNGEQFSHGQQILKNTLDEINKIKQGEIPLGIPSYFHHIITLMREAPENSNIYAVNCIDVLRWHNDPREVKYLKENMRAAERGVKINRAFIIDRKSLFQERSGPKRFSIIKDQINIKNIDVSIVWRDSLVEQGHRIQDWVLFTRPSKKLFIDYPDVADKTRVESAIMVLSEKEIERFLEDFHYIAECAVSNDKFLTELNHLTSY